MMFAIAGCSASEPLWSSPPETGPRAHPNFAEADRKELDTSRFVLIVDDDPNLLDVTRFVIESEGMAVETARNGEEALALLRSHRLPRLVLLDLMMPVMNGWEFLTEVAKDPLLKVIPVVVLTAVERTQAPGAVEILRKPMDLGALIRVVERYLRRDDDVGA
ncbi:MAG TPA: response regulator [Kofleriaceae bacterium]|nr:response regulator [Kofleriaceae bacterium]